MEAKDIAQLVECLSSIHKAMAQSPHCTEQCAKAPLILNTQEVETVSEAQSHSCLHSKLKTGLGYMTPCLQKQTKPDVVRWCTAVMPELRRLRHGDFEVFEASLAYRRA